MKFTGYKVLCGQWLYYVLDKEPGIWLLVICIDKKWVYTEHYKNTDKKIKLHINSLEDENGRGRAYPSVYDYNYRLKFEQFN